MEKDTDGDGIKTGRKHSGAQTQKKSNTDGDGISDFDYIEKRREEVRQASGTPDQELSDTNATDDFLPRGILCCDSGAATVRPAEQPNTCRPFQTTCGNIGQQKSLPDIYSITDIKIVSNPSRADMQIYGQAVQAMISYFG